jgi:hypothetical protein
MNRLEPNIRAYVRAGAKLGFYFHAVAYFSVNLLLIIINYSTTPHRLWFQWPLLGWGIGLLFHWFAAFVGPRLMSRLLDNELDKDR